MRLGTYICIFAVLFVLTNCQASIRDACAVKEDNSLEDSYVCKMADVSSEGPSTFVLTYRLAPKTARLIIYGWRESYHLIIEEGVKKVIDLIGKVDCGKIVIFSTEANVQQCVKLNETTTTGTDRLSLVANRLTHRNGMHVTITGRLSSRSNTTRAANLQNSTLSTGTSHNVHLTTYYMSSHKTRTRMFSVKWTTSIASEGESTERLSTESTTARSASIKSELTDIAWILIGTAIGAVTLTLMVVLFCIEYIILIVISVILQQAQQNLPLQAQPQAQQNPQPQNPPQQNPPQPHHYNLRPRRRRNQNL